MWIRASAGPPPWPTIWVPLRPESDIIFLGALIHYVLENEKYFREYVVHYTNASTILREDFRDTEDLGGIFSGLERRKEIYDPEDLVYEGVAFEESRQSMPATRKPAAATPRIAAAKRASQRA